MVTSTNCAGNMKTCICGKPKKHNLKTCGNKGCVNKKKTMHLKGKKRPEHSALMKKYAKEGKLDNWISKSNEELNSQEFKMKRLDKHGYQYNEDNINDVYSILLSDLQQTDKHKSNQLKNFICNSKYIYEDEYKDSKLSELTEDIIDRLDSHGIKKYHKIMNSVKSTISMRRNPRMGSSKSSKGEVIYDLTCNISGKKSLYVRSSYEKHFLSILEDHQVPWDYESIRVQTASGYYLPDFYVEHEGNKYLVEIKGYLEDYEEYYENKMKYAIDYCHRNNIEFVFIQHYKISDIQEIKKFILRR